MKNLHHISHIQKWVFAILTGILVLGCDIKIKEEPVQNYKARPEKSPDVKTPPADIPVSKDSLTITPSPVKITPDSNTAPIKDTTETLKQMDKNENKVYKKIYLYNLHKRCPVS